MSNALRIAHGPFGRVALLDMDRSLVRHAHPHCHVLIKAEGADTQFAVGERAGAADRRTGGAGQRLGAARLCARSGAAAHHHPRALYRAGLAASCSAPNWAASARAGLLRAAGRRAVAAHPAHRARPDPGDAGRSRRWRRARAAAVGPDDRGDRALHAPGARVGRSIRERSRGAASLPTGASAAPSSACAAHPGAAATSTRWRARRACRARISTGCSPAPRTCTPHVYLNVLRMELAVDAIVHRQRTAWPTSDRQARLQRAGAFHPLLPRPCRRQAERVSLRRTHGARWHADGCG